MSAVKVSGVMTSDVSTVTEGTPFKDVVRVMVDRQVSGVPVVGAGGTLVGIVTEADLLAAAEQHVDEHTTGRRKSFLEWFVRPKGVVLPPGVEDVRAADVMTRDVAAVSPDATVREAIKALLDAGVKRLPVVDASHRVVGIVSRRDLLRPFLRPDEEIAREIRDEILLRTMWIDPSSIDVAVRRGVVALNGQVESRSVREILVEFVHRVDGVVGVEDRLDFRVDDREVPPAEQMSELQRDEGWASRAP